MQEGYRGGLLNPATGVVKGTNDLGAVTGAPVIRATQALFQGRIKTMVPEAIAQAAGEVGALGDAIQAFKDAFDRNAVNNQWGSGRAVGSSYENPSAGQFSATFSGRVLGAITDASRVLIERGVERANRVAGTLDPVMESNRGLLTGESHAWSGKLVQASLNLIHDRIPVIGPYLAPFRQVVGNLAEKTIDWMPFAGLVNQIGADATARERNLVAQSLSVMALGALAMAYGNNVNGGGPTDPKQKGPWLSAHNQPWTFKNPVTGDWTSMQKLPPPMRGPLMAWGMIQDIQKYGGNPADALNQFGQAMNSLEFFPQIFQTLASAAGGQGATAWKYFAASEAGGVIPWELRRPAAGERTSAPDLASRYVSDPLEAAKRGIQAAIPGVERNVPAAINNLGEPRPNTNQGVGAVVNPYRTNVPDSDPTIAAFAKHGVNVQAPPATIARTPISPDEQRAFAELVGPKLVQQGEAMMATPTFQALPPDIQKGRLQALESDLRRQAAMAIIAKNPTFGQKMTSQPGFVAHPPKYLGVSDPARELQIDDAIRVNGDYLRSGGKASPPTREQQQLAQAYMARPNPQYKQWQAQQAQEKKLVPA
jgi:hypothetical protein